jgi:autophagy-related protein 16-1
MASLESQISSLRDELATVYKTQGQNAQRLLAMNETLREKEEASRIESENLRKAREEIAHLRRKVDQHAELMAEKDRTAQVCLFPLFELNHQGWSPPQVLHDEINTLQLELGQIEERNQILTKDNAKLLQRWLDDKQAQANKMNEANDFYEDMRSRHEAVINWRDGGEGILASGNGTSPSGNGIKEGESTAQTLMDGTKSQGDTISEQTPNGWLWTISRPTRYAYYPLIISYPCCFPEYQADQPSSDWARYQKAISPSSRRRSLVRNRASTKDI